MKKSELKTIIKSILVEEAKKEVVNTSRENSKNLELKEVYNKDTDSETWKVVDTKANLEGVIKVTIKPSPSKGTKVDKKWDALITFPDKSKIRYPDVLGNMSSETGENYKTVYYDTLYQINSGLNKGQEKTSPSKPFLDNRLSKTLLSLALGQYYSKDIQKDYDSIAIEV
jgi:hypothetical protein